MDSHDPNFSVIVCRCGHGRDCTHGVHEPGADHTFRPTFIVYPSLGRAYDMIQDQTIELENGALPSGYTHDNPHGHNQGQEHHHHHRHTNDHHHPHEPTVRMTFDGDDPGSSSRSDTRRQNHERMCESCRNARARQRQAAGSQRSREEGFIDRGGYPYNPSHMRALFGNNYMDRSAAHYHAAIAATERDAAARLEREREREREQQLQPRSQPGRDYELDDLRDRFYDDGSERSDPELDRNSNGSPPPRYEP